jgi:mRNA-degrading endonuclease RelE of RelBE toxin-antitoxin system
VSEDAAPERIAVTWSPEARADLRAIDRETAIQMLHCVDRYLSNRTGDVKKLKRPEKSFRLRCGDYRVFFDRRPPSTRGLSLSQPEVRHLLESRQVHQNIAFTGFCPTPSMK